MRLSYHGWAAVLLVLSFLLVVGGIALGVTPASTSSYLANSTEVPITCGSPWAPTVTETAQCGTGFGARGTLGLLCVLFGVVLFGGQLLVGMAVAGFRDAVANARQAAQVTTAGPEPSRPAPTV